MSNSSCIFICSKQCAMSSLQRFGQLSHVLRFNILDLEAKAVCEVLLYGSSKIIRLVNRHLIEATLLFIKSTKRFSLWKIKHSSISFFTIHFAASNV